MSQRRVVITGLGQVSPVGNDIDSAWRNLLAGQGGIGTITRFDASDLACQIAGEVKDFDIGTYISPKEARRMDVFIHYGIAAALQAVAEPLNYNVIEFAESASAEVQQDTMIIGLEVNQEGRDRAEVNRAFMQKYNKLTRHISANKALKSELQGRRANPLYQYKNGKQTQIGWQESAQIRVESTDFTAINQLIAQAQNDAGDYDALATEAQTLPDSLHHPEFGNIRLNKGECKEAVIIYQIEMN